MTTYKIETNSNGEIFVVALHGLTTGQNCGGPYKNEESAKRRIRDLKRRDAETANEKRTELAEHKPALDIGYDPADADLYNPNATTLAALGKNEAVRRIADGHLTYVVFGQSNFASKPMGVYPAVAKKFYRQQWR